VISFIGAYRYVLLPTSPRAVRWHTVRRMIRAELAVSAVAYDLEIPLRRNSARQVGITDKFIGLVEKDIMRKSLSDQQDRPTRFSACPHLKYMLRTLNQSSSVSGDVK
jgi:hypothetical protein